MAERITDLLTTTAIENGHLAHDRLYDTLKDAVRDHLPTELEVEDAVHQFLVKNSYVMPDEVRRQVYRATYQYRHRPTLEKAGDEKSRLTQSPIRPFGPQPGTYAHFTEQVAGAVIKGETIPASVTWIGWLAEVAMHGVFDVEESMRGHTLPLTLAAPYLFAHGNSLGEKDGKFVRRHSNGQGAGSFVQPGATIPAKANFDFTTAEADRNKMAVILGYSGELKEQSYTNIERLFRMAILNDTLEAYDSFLFDGAPAVPTVRPAALNAGVDSAVASGPLEDLELLAVRAEYFRMTHPVIIVNAVTFNHLSMKYGDEYLTAELNKIHDDRAFKGIPIITSSRYPADRVMILDVSLFQHRLAPFEWRVTEHATLVMADDDGTAPTMLATGAVEEDGSIQISDVLVSLFHDSMKARSLFQNYNNALRMTHRVSWLMADNLGTMELTGVNWTT